MAVLVELSGGLRGQRFVLSALSVVGRDPSCTVPLSDPSVSRRHAEIRRTPQGKWMLLDLESTHGTWIAGSRIREALLGDGDEIIVGRTRLLFEDRGEEEERTRTIVPGTAEWRAIGDHAFPADSELSDVADLRRQYVKLRAARELSHAIGAEQYLPVLLEKILDTAFRLLRAERGAVLLVEPETARPTARFERRRDGIAGEVALPQSIVQEVVRRREGVLSADAAVDDRFRNAGSIALHGIRSTMMVPMLYRGELLGILYLDSLSATNVFGPEDLEIFGTVAGQAAVAIKNAMLRRQVDEVANRLEAVVRMLPHGVFLLDSSGTILLRNPRAEELFPDLVPGARLDHLGDARLEDLLCAAPGEERELVQGGPPRRIFAVSAGAPLEGHAVVVVRDVTAEREREERATQAYQLALVGQLAGGVAHDFNNHLSVILGHADMLFEHVADGDLRKDVDLIRGAARRASTLTRQLLAFSRRDLVRPTAVDLNRAFADVEKLVTRALGETIHIENHLQSDLWPVHADPARIEQVIMNLVVNARDAMPDGGRVTFRTANHVLTAGDPRLGRDLPPGRYVELTVADTGSGMTPEVAARVFEPFFTTKERGKGTGLGLSSVYGTVKQAGGEITVHSVPGRGSSFTLLLPASAEEPQARVTAAEAPAPRGVGTILLVEDEPDLRTLVARILHEAGYTVLVADCGERALRDVVANETAIDLLLTDLVMTGMSGRELADTLAERWPALHILYMSGYPDEVIGRHGPLDAPLLPKPFTKRELLAQVAAALSRG